MAGHLLEGVDEPVLTVNLTETNPSTGLVSLTLMTKLQGVVFSFYFKLSFYSRRRAGFLFLNPEAFDATAIHEYRRYVL